MLRVDHLHKTYGAVEAIADLTLDVREQEFVCVVGSSGCGKTTLLKCMAGLLEPTAGGIYLHGERITSPPPTMAPVFQDYTRSPFPWMTVRRNVAFPLRRSKVDRETATAAVEVALEAVGLTGVLDRYPWQLSGGMQQRVAIARALAYQPEVLLMDEPFGSVDAQTRADLQDLILLVRREYGVTVVFVTHDLDEAVYLADRIIVLRPAPTSVQQILDIDLPTPRHQLETKELSDFARLRASIYRLIRQSPAPQHGPSHVGRAVQAAPSDLSPGLGAPGHDPTLGSEVRAVTTRCHGASRQSFRTLADFEVSDDGGMPMTPVAGRSPDVDVELLPAAAASDSELVGEITELVDRVFAVAEEGLWVEGTRRATPTEVAEMIAGWQIALAHIAAPTVGVVRIQQLGPEIGEVGLLAVDPAHRGEGIGRELMTFAERLSWERGLSVMQIELLVPRGWTHPTKQFLHAWYTRLGYRPTRSGTIDERYPHLARRLATPCDVVVYHKDLASAHAPAKPT